MVPKIDKLTPEQEAMIPAFRQEWLEVGLSTEPVDRKASTEAVQNLYRAAGLQAPVVFHFDSPVQCILSMHTLRNTKPRDMLNDQLQGSVIGQLFDQLKSQLEDQLRYQLEDQLWDHLSEQLSDHLNEQLSDQLYTDTVFSGGQDAWLLALYDFGQKIGIRYTCDAQFEAYKQYARTSG